MRLGTQVDALGPLQLAVAVSDRNSKGAGGHARLEAVPGVMSESGKLRVTAYSADGTFAVIAVPAAVGQKDGGACFVGADYFARLLDVVGSVGGTLSLEVLKGKLRVKAGSFFSSVVVANGEFFPAMPAAPEGGASLPSASLLGLFDYVGHAVCRDEERPALRCVHLAREGEALVGRATDGHRMARARVATPLAARLFPDGELSADGVCLSSGSLHDVRALLKGCEEVVLRLGSARAHFEGCCGEGAESALSLALLDSRFPNVDRALREDAAYVEVGVAALRAALARAAIGSGGASSKSVLVECAGCALKLTREDSQDYAVVEFSEEVALASPGVASARVLLPVQQLLDALKPLRAETVGISLADARSPVQLRGVGGDSEYLVALMPVRQGA